jgi:uncharacterized DUF497 family protein
MVTFDPDKNIKNLSKHRIPLIFGVEVLDDPNSVEGIDDRMNYGETRWNLLGMVKGVVYSLTYTERDTGPHFISVRLADPKETNRYFTVPR